MQKKQDSADWSFQLVAVLFGGSGCAALIYELVWFQSLELVIGSTAISLGLLLAVFMGGMSLGAAVLPRFIPRPWHPLRAYAFLELCVGISALVLLWAMPLAGGIYIVAGGSSSIDSAVPVLFCTVCLLVPTFLMGAAFPIVARWFNLTAKGASRIGFLYTANIAGAFIGSLAAGFYLLRYYNATASTGVAVAMNLIAAATAFQLSRSVPSCVAENETEARPSQVQVGGNSAATREIWDTARCS